MLARALFAIVATAAALAVSPVASAEHTVFDYTVDRFEATGNLIGAFVDEFDDGVVTWNQNFPGNAFETGGLLHLATPACTQRIFSS